MNNIVIVTKNMAAGGAERVIAQLLGEWCTKGCHCTLILLEKEEIFYKLPSVLKVYEIGKIHKQFYIDKFLKYRQVRKLIKLIQPDIVLSLPEEIGIYVLLAMVGTKTPIVVSERNNPWVMPYKRVTRILRKMVYPRAAGVVFQTDEASYFFHESIRRKGIVLQNPLDLTRIPRPWQGERKKVIVTAGRLEPQKNQKLLIDAFAIVHKDFPEYRLLIYGDGSLRIELENYAREILIENSFEFRGNSSHLLEEIKDASLFVMTSDYEGVPNVLIEAMSAGIPVVSTDCAPGGAAALIKDGINGYLVPTGNVKLLIEVIKQQLSDSVNAEKMAHEALKLKEQFDATIVAEKWFDYLKTISER